MLQQLGHTLLRSPKTCTSEMAAPLPISRPGFVPSAAPRRGHGQQTGLEAHRGLVLPSACTKIAGEMKWRLKSLVVPQNISLDNLTWTSMESSGPHWSSPTGSKRKPGVETVPPASHGCLGVLPASKSLIFQL